MVDDVTIPDLPPVASAELADQHAVSRSGLTKMVSTQQMYDLFVATFTAGASAAYDTWLELVALGEDNEDAIAALVASVAGKLALDGSNIGGNAPALRTAVGLAYGDLPWLAVPVGGVVDLPTHLTGCAIPGTGSSLYRFAQLTAGLTGAAAYNENVLGSESVTGTAPLVVATAAITLTGSPMLGQTINLLNTEGRFIRSGTTPGTLRNGTMQGHWHDVVSKSGAAGNYGWSGTANADDTTPRGTAKTMVTDGSNGTPRIGNDTYPKHIEFTSYMRVK